MIETIILSGGWGYGNLGDIAICKSSIELIRRKYPQAKILLITNDVEEEREVVSGVDNVLCIQSFYKKLFEDTFSYFYQTKVSMLQRIKKRICSFFIKFISVKRYKKKLYGDILSDFEVQCSEADIYIMSGGGYLNDWKEQLITKYLEVDIMNKYNIPVYLIGQSIGPFANRNNYKICYNLLKCVKGVIFRDNYSFSLAQEMKLQNVGAVTPDLAVIDFSVCKKDNIMVYIPFDYKFSEQNLVCLVNELKIISSRENLKIVITISQYWIGSINNACLIFFMMKREGIDCELNIVCTYNELNNIIKRARVVFSENLHGLIIGYRSGCKILALNVGHKFHSFMEQTGNNAIIDRRKLVKDSLVKQYFNSEYKNYDFEIRNKIINTVDSFLPGIL